MERLVKTGDKVDKAACARSGAVYHAMRLLKSLFFSHPHALLSNASLHALDNDRTLQRNGATRLQFTPANLPFVLALLSHDGVQVLRIERPAVERASVLILDDNGNGVGRSATPADVLSSL